jgi:diguanylate cyclase (GGDEF)-like protein
MLWDASWWGWHYLRLLAYIAALVFVIFSETRLLREFSKYGSMMNQLALTDSLTGINNRRHFNLQLTNEYARAKRYDTPLSLVLLDLDHFKVLNDAHGHHEGDKVLKHVATLIGQHLRTSDFFARFGGEEFVILLPSTNQNEAFQFIERIREEISHLTLTSDSKKIHEGYCKFWHRRIITPNDFRRGVTETSRSSFVQSKKQWSQPNAHLHASSTQLLGFIRCRVLFIVDSPLSSTWSFKNKTRQILFAL